MHLGNGPTHAAVKRTWSRQRRRRSKRISSLKGHIQDLAHIRGTVIPPNGYCEPRGIREEDKQIVSELYAAARMLAIPAEEIKLTGDYRSVQGLVD